MSASGETAIARKSDEETNAGAGATKTPTSDQGEENGEINEGNRRGNQIHRRTELVQIHTSHIYFKSDAPALGSLLGLLYENYILERILKSLERRLRVTWRE